MLTNVPSCDEGCTRNEYRLGSVCPVCHTVVREVAAEKLETITYVRAPAEVDTLINPVVLSMLSERFSIGGFNLIHYITDPQYRIPENQVGRFTQLIAQYPFERGLNSFYRNFKDIKEFLFSISQFRLKIKGKLATDFLRRLLDENEDSIFTKHLPIPHRSTLVIEDGSSGGVYLDEFTLKAIDAILGLAGIDTLSAKGELSTNKRLRESRAIRSNIAIAEYYKSIAAKRLAKKEGVFRKQVYASRSHFSFRAVITSTTTVHNHRNVRIPWIVATSALQVHLKNKLYRLGFTPNEAQAFLNKHANTFHPLMDLLFKELIAEAPTGLGIPIALCRPPSLKRGSIQSVFVSEIKRPEEGKTIDISILIVKQLNADFDGDALQFILLLDNYMTEAFKNLAPFKSAYSLNNIRTLSNSLEHSKTVVANTANWMEHRDEPIDPEILARMHTLPEAPPSTLITP